MFRFLASQPSPAEKQNSAGTERNLQRKLPVYVYFFIIALPHEVGLNNTLTVPRYGWGFSGGVREVNKVRVLAVCSIQMSSGYSVGELGI